MAINLKFDLIGNPEPPSIVLANRNGNKLGQLNVNVESIDVSDKFNAASEFSFTLNKYIDGEPTPLWDKVKDFKLVYCPEWDLWFEIKVELDETTETVKTVFCTQLGQAELSQIMVYNIHINEEGDPNWDTNNETYKSTILYDEENTDISLLHRVLKDKAPHYSIAHVDKSIQRIQKTFSFDDISICDAFDEIAEEIGCLFVYNSNSTKGGKPNRTISVYDLQQKCNDCGHRGEFTDKCPKCGSINIKYGYGEDTTIFVTSDELATQGIQLVTDTDSVKNCFKLEGGDDLMTATIRNCNPNGSDYIWYFSDALKEDMSKELVEKLESYDEKYERYYNTESYGLNENAVNQYNKLVEDFDANGNLVGGYSRFYDTKSTCLNCGTKGYFYEQCPNCDSKNLLTGKELQTIDTTITGYPNLMTAYYNTIDLLLYLKSGLMPNVDIETNKTSAEEQIALLTTSSLSPVAVNVKEAKDISETTSKSAVLSMAKVLIKSTYKVEAETLAFYNVSDTDGVIVAKTWEGKFTVTNYSDDTDTATSDSISVIVNVDAKTFIEQKIKKALNKENTDDYSITDLFAKEYDKFCTEIKKYALNPLDSFSKACDTCLSILAEQGVGNDGSNEDNETDEATKKVLYDALYKPYFDKQQAINTEIKTRQDEIAIIEGVWDRTDENNPQCTTWGLQQYIEECQQDIQEKLDFEKHLGEDLWLEFCSYRREDKYSNSNYVSDGLNNAELFDRALEFIEVAEEEIFKSAELQHSISATLNNLLSLDKFKPLFKSFKTGNWIRVQIDDKVYKLRLLEYGFGYGDSESISVEFSDVTKIKNGVTDVKEVLEQASSMASSYDSVQRQAQKGNVARSTIDQWLVDGLNAANMQIASNDSEEVLLTKNGLLARSYDDITGTYSPEQLKVTHNIMAYTDNNWETVKQAIGKHGYKFYDKEISDFVDKIGYGMTTEFVDAGHVTGSQIIGGDIYSDNYSVTKRTGSYLNLRDGTFSFGGGSLRYENGKLIISSEAADTNITEVNEEWLKTTSVYAENLQVNSAKIQGKLTASQIDVGDLNADDIIGTTITGKTIKSSDFIGGYLLIGDENKIGDYAEIANDGTLTCTNVDIKGGTFSMGQIYDDDGNICYDDEGNICYHTWVSDDGVLNTYDARIQGTLTSSTIIGGTINGSTLQIGKMLDEEGNHTGDYYTTISSDGFLKSVEGEFEDCTITGGSLKMGSYDGGYSAWISSEDGVLHAYGAYLEDVKAVNGYIGGWIIDTEKICSDNNLVGLLSDSVAFSSLVTTNETSPLRIYAGRKPIVESYEETIECQSDGVGDMQYAFDEIFEVSQVGGRIQSVNIQSTSSDTLSIYSCNVDFISDSEIRIYGSTSGVGKVEVILQYEYIWEYASSFMVLEDGSLYANAAQIKGHIEATSGYIGDTTSGFEISSTYITNGKTSYDETVNNGVYLGTDGIGLGKGKFYVNSQGVLKATDADIQGKVTATSGYIGGWTLGKTNIEINASTHLSDEYALYSDEMYDTINDKTYTYQVYLTAKGVYVNGRYDTSNESAVPYYGHKTWLEICGG